VRSGGPRATRPRNLRINRTTRRGRISVSPAQRSQSSEPGAGESRAASARIAGAGDTIRPSWRYHTSRLLFVSAPRRAHGVHAGARGPSKRRLRGRFRRRSGAHCSGLAFRSAAPDPARPGGRGCPLSHGGDVDGRSGSDRRRAKVLPDLLRGSAGQSSRTGYDNCSPAQFLRSWRPSCQSREDRGAPSRRVQARAATRTRNTSAPRREARSRIAATVWMRSSEATRALRR
jgi:hypothetical protein